MKLIWQKLILPKLLFILRLPKFLYQFMVYRQLSKKENVPLLSLRPCLSGTAHPFDRHYMIQDGWLMDKLMLLPHQRHVSVGGRVDGFVWQWLAVGKELLYLDINPPPLEHERLEFMSYDISRGIDPYMIKASDKARAYFDDKVYAIPSHTCHSISCLHVLEHIGLGRYGDTLDPEGWRKGIAELARITAWWGALYISVPIGRDRVCFNGHRIFSPRKFSDELSIHDLRVIDFAAIDDAGKLHEHATPEDYETATYALGLYHLLKVPK